MQGLIPWRSPRCLSLLAGGSLIPSFSRSTVHAPNSFDLTCLACPFSVLPFQILSYSFSILELPFTPKMGYLRRGIQLWFWFCSYAHGYSTFWICSHFFLCPCTGGAPATLPWTWPCNALANGIRANMTDPNLEAAFGPAFPRTHLWVTHIWRTAVIPSSPFPHLE